MYFELFKLSTMNDRASENLTEYINHKTYKVNQKDVFEEWTDGNYIQHRDVVRQQISGSFEVGFKNEAYYNYFCNLLKENKKPGGYFTAWAYVNNLDEMKKVNVYIDMEATRMRDALNDRSWSVFNITIEER